MRCRVPGSFIGHRWPAQKLGASCSQFTDRGHSGELHRAPQLFDEQVKHSTDAPFAGCG